MSKLRWTVLVWAILCICSIAVFWGISRNLAAQGMALDFRFLTSDAGFDVNESFIPYNSEMSYLRVVLVGTLNTIFLAINCLIAAMVIGGLAGFIGAGQSPLGRAAIVAYVEVVRSLPKILLLLAIYFAAVNGLPAIRQAWSIGPLIFSNRAVYGPSFDLNGFGWLAMLVAFAGCFVPLGPSTPDNLARKVALRSAIVGLPLAVAILTAKVTWPEFRGFDYAGGWRTSVQFFVVFVTLSVYHGAQIAEVVRGGIMSISAGQTEAALSLGLTRRQANWFVILPQVIRAVIPPLGNQTVNLTKNTSVAIAVGYSDLMSVVGTAINQTFRPLELMLVTIGIYLALCLGLSAVLSYLNNSLKIVGKGG